MSSESRGSGSSLTVDTLTVGTSLSAPGFTTQLIPTTSSNPAAPATTVSTSAVMAGVGMSFVPIVTGSGKVRITISGCAGTQTGATICTVTAQYGTGSAPANGAAVTGTSTGSGGHQVRAAAAAATPAAPFVIDDIVTGLTPGTTYWVDLSFKTAAGADAAVLGALSIIVEDRQ